MNSGMKTMEGGCHCGRVRFRVTAELDRVTYCNCSMCTKKGFLHLIVPPEQFELVSGKGDLATYTFNTGVARHTFCRHCGIHPFYVPRSDPDKIDVTCVALTVLICPRFRCGLSMVSIGSRRCRKTCRGDEKRTRW